MVCQYAGMPAYWQVASGEAGPPPPHQPTRGSLGEPPSFPVLGQLLDVLSAKAPHRLHAEIELVQPLEAGV